MSRMSPAFCVGVRSFALFDMGVLPASLFQERKLLQSTHTHNVPYWSAGVAKMKKLDRRKVSIAASRSCETVPAATLPLKGHHHSSELHFSSLEAAYTTFFFQSIPYQPKNSALSECAMYKINKTGKSKPGSISKCDAMPVLETLWFSTSAAL